MSIKVNLEKQLDHFKLQVSFQSESRRIGILGASGCGKSMTLRSIAGVWQVDEGFVCVDDRILYDSRKDSPTKVNQKPQKRNIGYLFQNYALFPSMTVEQNIRIGLRGKKKENEERTADMIRKFRLQGLEKRLPAELSGGQQQRTALARIMAYQPDVILLDEPFSALDAYLSDQLQQEMLEMLEDYDGTVLLVSHNRDEIYRFCEELLIMEEGKMICHGKTREVFANPELKSVAKLTGCKNIAQITVIDSTHFQIPDWDCTIYVNQNNKKDIPNDATAIGYRAHEFVPIWGEEQKNCISFQLKSMSELPFERKYFLAGKNGAEICWFLQKSRWSELDEKGVPDYLQMNPDEVLFLR